MRDNVQAINHKAIPTMSFHCTPTITCSSSANNIAISATTHIPMKKHQNQPFLGVVNPHRAHTPARHELPTPRVLGRRYYFIDKVGSLFHLIQIGASGVVCAVFEDAAEAEWAALVFNRVEERFVRCSL